MSRVTVLMPVYNGECYLRETIDSVLNQGFCDFEFLIINDGSTDHTREIVLSYSDDRIRLVDNEQNIGLVASLNKGLDMIDTEYIARMDADDLWDPSKLEKQIALLDSRPEIGLCGTSIRKFGIIKGDMFFPEDNEGLKVGFLFYCMMSHPSVVFRRSMLAASKLRYKKEAFPAEDYQMWIDCLNVTQIYNIPEPLVYYRQHAEQICQEKKVTQELKTNEVRKEMLLRFWPDAPAEEVDYYLNSFLGAGPDSVSEYYLRVEWIKKLEQANRLSHYGEERLLHHKLVKYLDWKYYTYLREKYNNKDSWVSRLIGIFSFEWRVLPIKLQIKYLLKK